MAAFRGCVLPRFFCRGKVPFPEIGLGRRRVPEWDGPPRDFGRKGWALNSPSIARHQRGDRAASFDHPSFRPRLRSSRIAPGTGRIGVLSVDGDVVFTSSCELPPKSSEVGRYRPGPPGDTLSRRPPGGLHLQRWRPDLTSLHILHWSPAFPLHGQFRERASFTFLLLGVERFRGRGPSVTVRASRASIVAGVLESLSAALTAGNPP
jgi:hypothetical protein